VVDDRHHLMIESDVTNDSNDQKQLYPMAMRAKTLLNTKTLTLLADAGYYETENLYLCEQAHMTPFVPIPNKSASTKQQDRFTQDQFHYDAFRNVYVCPTGEALTPMGKPSVKNHKKRQLFISASKSCVECRIKNNCLAKGTTRRKLYRSEYQTTVDAHKERMEQQGAGKMKQRASLVEHPFGTIKMRAGWQHFLARSFEKVKGEWSLMNLAYNMTRALNILGMEAFIAYCHPLFRMNIQPYLIKTHSGLKRGYT